MARTQSASGVPEGSIAALLSQSSRSSKQNRSARSNRQDRKPGARSGQTDQPSTASAPPVETGKEQATPDSHAAAPIDEQPTVVVEPTVAVPDSEASAPTIRTEASEPANDLRPEHTQIGFPGLPGAPDPVNASDSRVSEPAGTTVGSSSSTNDASLTDLSDPQRAAAERIRRDLEGAGEPNAAEDIASAVASMGSTPAETPASSEPVRQPPSRAFAGADPIGHSATIAAVAPPPPQLVVPRPVSTPASAPTVAATPPHPSPTPAAAPPAPPPAAPPRATPAPPPAASASPGTPAPHRPRPIPFGGRSSPPPGPNPFGGRFSPPPAPTPRTPAPQNTAGLPAAAPSGAPPASTPAPLPQATPAPVQNASSPPTISTQQTQPMLTRTRRPWILRTIVAAFVIGLLIGAFYWWHRSHRPHPSSPRPPTPVTAPTWVDTDPMTHGCGRLSRVDFDISSTAPVAVRGISVDCTAGSITENSDGTLNACGCAWRIPSR